MELTLSNFAGLVLLVLAVALVVLASCMKRPNERASGHAVPEVDLSYRSHEAIVELALAALVAANTSNHKLAAELQRRGEGRPR